MGLEARASERYAVGVDLGGTNFRAAVFRGAERVAEHREPVGERRDPDSIAERIARFVERASPAGTPVGVGIAAMLRGTEGVVAQSPHLRWRDVPFGDVLRARLPGRFVGIYNDVNAITYGEYVAGAGRGARDVIAVFVGTGIGGGIIANGELITGFSNTSAEVGHVKVVYGDDARPCNCGLRGCVEAYAGGVYLLERLRRELGEQRRASLAVELAGSADAVNVAHVDEAYGADDAYARALWHEIVPLLGAALANLITTLNPEVLVLGGGVLSRAPRLHALVVEATRAMTNPPALDGLRIVDAELGDHAGVVGAAALALHAR